MFHPRVSLLVCESFKLITSDWQSSKLSLLMTQQTASRPVLLTINRVNGDGWTGLAPESVCLCVCVYGATLWSSGSIVTAGPRRLFEDPKQWELLRVIGAPAILSDPLSFPPMEPKSKNFPHNRLDKYTLKQQHLDSIVYAVNHMILC